MIDLDMQDSTFMIMIYELLRKIFKKLRKVMKKNEKNLRKSEESYENK